MEDYLRGGNALRWPTIGLSVMATQASAITFLSDPGQAYEDGMRFVQFYFGLPLAMVVISAVFVPIYYRLKVYTAYEYLEHRFDLKTRAAGRVPVPDPARPRGRHHDLRAGDHPLARSWAGRWSRPSWPSAALVIVYTVSGGTQAVSQTQKQQMIVMLRRHGGGRRSSSCWRLPRARVALAAPWTSPARSAA